MLFRLFRTACPNLATGRGLGIGRFHAAVSSPAPQNTAGTATATPLASAPRRDGGKLYRGGDGAHGNTLHPRGCSLVKAAGGILSTSWQNPAERLRSHTGSTVVFGFFPSWEGNAGVLLGSHHHEPTSLGQIPLITF